MVPGEVLARWLGDREAQQRSFDRVMPQLKKGASALMTQLGASWSKRQLRTPRHCGRRARFIDKGRNQGLVRE